MYSSKLFSLFFITQYFSTNLTFSNSLIFFNDNILSIVTVLSYNCNFILLNNSVISLFSFFVLLPNITLSASKSNSPKLYIWHFSSKLSIFSSSIVSLRFLGLGFCSSSSVLSSLSELLFISFSLFSLFSLFFSIVASELNLLLLTIRFIYLKFKLFK